jgi:N-acyl amino acid synthase of PEP-CTERM/exosortase system
VFINQGSASLHLEDTSAFSPIASPCIVKSEALHRPSLVEIFREAFEVVPVDSPALSEEVHRLRYQIYCVENGFEDPRQHPDGLERDRFDAHSALCLLMHRPSGIFIGTVRLILPLAQTPRESFSVQQACHDPIVSDPRRFPCTSTGEISRICISRERRRQCDAPPEIMQHAFVGLAQASVRLSVENGITHWLGLMEPIFIKRVARLGIYFDKIGDPVEYHGKRQPISADLTAMLATVHSLQPEVWEVMTDEGRLWPLDSAAAVA